MSEQQLELVLYVLDGQARSLALILLLQFLLTVALIITGIIAFRSHRQLRASVEQTTQQNVQILAALNRITEIRRSSVDAFDPRTRPVKTG